MLRINGEEKNAAGQTLADYLASRMEGARVFDAEAVGNAVRDNYPGCPYGVVFEDYPLWGDFCYQLRDEYISAGHTWHPVRESRLYAHHHACGAGTAVAVNRQPV